ncbi:hypothetical protein K439DRAFT_1615372 [Ramaria rubella]|nr:hypothetical protein K439DRAFT_1615372 [Ramaria rubella]
MGVTKSSDNISSRAPGARGPDSIALVSSSSQLPIDELRNDESGGGAAAPLFINDELRKLLQFHLDPASQFYRVPVYETELVRLILAGRLLLTQRQDSALAAIGANSLQDALRATEIHHPKPTSDLVDQVLKPLLCYMQKTQSLHQVPGYKGVPGNEFVN